jgi:dihydrofolate synthase/folylpolyglutamate synthase
MKGLTSYKNSLDKLLTLVDLEKFSGTRGSRVKFNLSRISVLLKALGDPHKNGRVVHVAGSKGKGSVAAMVSSILYSNGYKVGMFSSPHIHTFRERIRVNGKPISEELFVNLVDRIWPITEKISNGSSLGAVTLFETLTAMAFVHFQDVEADFQVVEVGLGGKLDSTNVVDAMVSVITPISFDHMHILGETLSQIAREKAGIIKRGVPVIVAPQPREAMDVIRRVAITKDAPMLEVQSEFDWVLETNDLLKQRVRIETRCKTYFLNLPLLGKYQIANAATAIGVVERLQTMGNSISNDAISRGFESVDWPCRMEVLQDSPTLVIDGAHNPQSIKSVMDSLPAYFDFNKLVVIFGASRDKNLEEMVKEIALVRPTVLVVRSRHPRAADPGILSKNFQDCKIHVGISKSIAEAIYNGVNIAGVGGLVLVTGSLFVAAEARENILDIDPELYF